MSDPTVIIDALADWGIDLSSSRAGLAKMIEHGRFFYRELCDHETRRDNPGPRPLAHRDPNPWVMADDEWTIEDWEALRRKPGRPANDPLRFIYQMARGYWEYDIGQGSWSPRSERHTPTDTVPITASAAFLLAFAQSVDPGFTAANCNAVYDRERRTRHSHKAQERRAASRREHHE